MAQFVIPGWRVCASIQDPEKFFFGLSVRVLILLIRLDRQSPPWFRAPDHRTTT
jgi:hypothetical protein